MNEHDGIEGQEEKQEPVSEKARRYHERIKQQKETLKDLRSGKELATFQWQMDHPGSRIAPVIEQLRNCYGFDIDGNGAVSEECEDAAPYRLRDSDQMPQLIKVIPKYKDAYYESDYWEDIREKRRKKDSYKCVLCDEWDSPLQCHHVIYFLFKEQLSHLITVCVDCHEILHRHSRLKFPSGIRPDHLKIFGFEPEIEEWLLP